MNETLNVFTTYFLLVAAFIIPVLMLMVINKNRSLIPPPKERNFRTVLADWARQQGMQFTPQKVTVISGVYNNRWYSIATANEENALQIRMRVNNPRQTSLQIFGDWLEDSGVIAFVSRFRIYSSPSGLGETLFDTGTRLREALIHFPGFRARFDLNPGYKDPNHLHYSLLTDLPGTDTLDTILASLARFCDAFELQAAPDATGEGNRLSTG